MLVAMMNAEGNEGTAVIQGIPEGPKQPFSECVEYGEKEYCSKGQATYQRERTFLAII